MTATISLSPNPTSIVIGSGATVRAKYVVFLALRQHLIALTAITGFGKVFFCLLALPGLCSRKQDFGLFHIYTY
jgi:hypothetical protein